jgi:hypothetical protein
MQPGQMPSTSTPKTFSAADLASKLWLRVFRINHRHQRDAELLEAKIKALSADIELLHLHADASNSQKIKRRANSTIREKLAIINQYTTFQKKNGFYYDA